MDINMLFEPADQFGQLLQNFYTAPEEEKQAAVLAICHSTYITRLRSLQSFSGVGFLQGLLPEEKINIIKKDFFFNPAITGLVTDRKTRLGMPYHRHDYLELVIVLRGKYTQSINGTLHEHRAGEICMLNPNVIHRDLISGPHDRVVFFGLSKNYLQEELAQAFAPHPELLKFVEYREGRRSRQYVRFAPASFRESEEIIMQIAEENLSKKPGHSWIIKGLLVRLFDQFVRDGNYDICCQTTSEIEENLIAEILEYMKGHMSSVTREETAAFFHFNPDYLNRMMKRVTGRSYSGHLRDLRLTAAAGRLENTQASVNTIIRDLGFTNKGYFNRIFKEKYGMLPGEYRNN